MSNIDDHTTEFRSGFIAIIGAPNVGKSTLLNRILGKKVSITSKKPQTTRNRIIGIAHRPHAQLIFIDTPGVHKAQKTLHTRIVDTALAAMEDVDIILVLVDPAFPTPPSETHIIRNLSKNKKPVILALNKIDLVNKLELLTKIDHWRLVFPFRAIIPISAKQGDQVDRLVDTIVNLLPPGPPLFPSDTLTDISDEFMTAEIIREKIFRLTGQEIPYATAVTVDAFSINDRENRIHIHATIHVERPSQKGMIIGKQGKKLKQIGVHSRKSIERLLDFPVFLKLFVRVQKNWSNDTRALRRFGY
jgi:GTP-binding protein Era